MDDDQRFLHGSKAICKFLGDISGKTLKRWMTQHGLPIARMGNALVADKELLTDWLLYQIPRNSRPETEDEI